MPVVKTLFSGLVLGAILATFSINSVAHSGRKAFWRDEAYTVSTIAGLRLLPTLASGLSAQGSSSPLDYLISHITYSLRTPLRYLKLQPHQYLRLHNILLLWIIMWWGWGVIRYSSKELYAPLAYVISAGFYLFNSTIYYYSTELRPYTLWAALSFLILITFKYQTRWKTLPLALALTQTASLIQITSMLVVFTYIHKLKVRLDNTLPFILAIAAALYYHFHSRVYSYPTPSWGQFWDFWSGFIPTIILGIILTVYYFRHRNQNSLVAVMTAACWVIIGPVTFYLITKGGFFFDPRQYIYYQSVQAFLLFESVVILLTNHFRPRYLLVAFVLFLIFQLPQTNLSLPVQSVRLLVYGQPISLPVNYPKVASLIPGSIPGSYRFIATDQYHLDNKAALKNLEIWWDYLNIIYPQSIYPRDTSRQLVVRARQFSIELVDITEVP